jgi:hypothetical protein
MQGLRKGILQRGFFSGDFERYVVRALELEHLSLCRGSLRGTWSLASFLGTLKDM